MCVARLHDIWQCMLGPRHMTNTILLTRIQLNYYNVLLLVTVVTSLNKSNMAIDVFD